MDLDGLVDVGRIASAHGVRGAFRVIPLTDFPDRFKTMDSLDLYDSSGDYCRRVSVLSVRFRPDKGDVLVISGDISDRDQAQALRGMIVKVSKADRPQLPPGDYWIDDLVGLSVVEEETGLVVGELVDVLATGASDVYMVRRPEGADFGIPAVRRYVSSVDLNEKTITVSQIRELMDL
ncbi:MAG: 16S rRNA processing protein RimM [Dethiosulfovibrio peptidovorans]|nr:MAG: 16S rRNA processing protein RimM [Dethiosulfovibrio peptidovorans]